MIKKTIGEIEAKIHGADAISDDRKRELLQLLGTLKNEVGTLSKTHDEQAAKHCRVSHNFPRMKSCGRNKIHNCATFRCGDCVRPSMASKNPIRNSSQIVNNISNTLSNLGI